MAQDPTALTGKLLEAAKRAGAEAADALVVEGTSVSIDVQSGALEHAERSEGIDLGLRVICGHKQAVVSSSDASELTIEEMAQRAVAMAMAAPDDASVGLAEADEIARDWDLDALQLAEDAPEPEPAIMQEEAARAEQAAHAVAGVSQVQGSSAGYSRTRMHLAASNGFTGGYARTQSWLSLTAISGEGSEMERDYNGEGRVFRADMPSTEEIGRIAGERAAARRGAKQPPTGTYPVLFDERVSASLIGHLLGAVNGAAIVRGSSFLRDRLGEIVLPENLSLTEDPLRPRSGSSRPFDGEGLATGTRKIIDNGRLTGWTLDLASARKLGMKSTANAARGTSSPPSPSVGNVWLTQGTQSPAEIMRNMGTGLLVTSLIGSTINPNTGDYSRGAFGFWIEGGEIAYPVNECTIASNLTDMLARLLPANDANPFYARKVPSLMVDGMMIAGG